MDIKRIRRNTFILTLWTLLFLLWFHWFMLTNWDFDIFVASHWQYIYHQWWHEGWVIKGGYFWTFALSLFFVFPFWILSSCFFLSINYSQKFEKLFWPLIYKRKTQKVQKQTGKIRVKKKKSYKEVRPKPFSSVGDTMLQSLSGSPSPSLDMEEAPPTNLATPATHFSHRELSEDMPMNEHFAIDNNFDEIQLPNDDFDPVKEDIPQIITNSGAFLLSDVEIGKEKIDFIALSKQTAYLILQDNQLGDWLADEERFNDEDPLWFSESAHRISPITQLKRLEKSFLEVLKEQGLSLETKLVLIKTDGNIINAEDMLDTWKEMNVMVVRSNKGRPEELPVFGEVFPDALSSLEPENIETITNALQKKGE